MRKLLFILCLVPAIVSAQYTARHLGETVMDGEGNTAKISAANIPGVPDSPDPTWTDLIVWYEFNETSGTYAYDSHTNNYTATVSGATQTAGGLVCDGADDYAFSTNLGIVGTTETFLFWVQPNGDETCHIIGGQTGAFEINITSGYTLNVAIASGSSSTSTDLTLTNGVMNFVSVVIDGSTVRFGVNGVYENETYSLTPSAATRYFGASALGVNDLNGTLKKVAWFSDAKCDEYITAFYNSGSGTSYSAGDPYDDCGVEPMNIFKKVTYVNSSIVDDVNSEANVQSIWNSSFSVSSNAILAGWDSIKIVDNDTVWYVYLAPGLDGEGAGIGNLGSYARGRMYLNGTNSDDDTLTYANYKMKVYFPSSYVYSAGSKLCGIAVLNRPGAPGGCNNPVSGLVYGPSCAPTEPYYDEEVGSSMRHSTSWSTTGTHATYLYHHGLDWKPCGNWTAGLQVHGLTLQPIGEWFEVNIRVILNSVPSEGNGAADGILEMYRNDTLIAQKTDVIYRNYSDQYINYFYGDVLTRQDLNRTDPTYILFSGHILWREDEHMNFRTARNLGDVIDTPQF